MDKLKIEHWINQVGLLFTALIVFWSPFSGGARLPTLLLAILGLVYLVVYKTKAYQQVEVKRWSVVFVLLWAPMWMSLLTSIDKKMTLVAIAWFSLLYFAGVALTQVLKKEASRTTLAKVIMATIVIWFVDSVVQYVFGVDLRGIPFREDGRVTGLFTDLHQGIIVLPVLPLACYVLIRQQKFAWAVGLMLMAGWMMSMSGSRGYLYILMLIVIGMIFHLRIGLKKLLILFAIPFFVVLVSHQMSKSLIAMKIAQTEQVVKPNLSSFDKINLLLSYRLNLWETGFNMFLAHPFTGIGSNNYKRAYGQYVSRADDPFVHALVHSHNIYVELMSETGLFGLFGLMGIVGLCRTWYKSASKAAQQQAWPFALPLMAIYFPINTTQPMLVPWWFPLLMLLACGFIASLQSETAGK